PGSKTPGGPPGCRSLPFIHLPHGPPGSVAGGPAGHECRRSQGGRPIRGAGCCSKLPSLRPVQAGRRWKTWAAGRCPSPGDRAFAGFSTGAPGEVLHELAESSQLVAHALHRAGGRGLFEVEGHLQVLEIQVKIIENVAQVVSDFVSEGEHGGRACTIT